MRKDRKKGLIASSALHLLALVLMIFGLPTWLLPKPPVEPSAITVELLPITGITNIKPADKPPAPEPKKEEVPDKPKPPSPPVKTAEPAPTPPPPPPPKKEDPLLTKKEEKKPEPKKEEKKPEKQKPKEDPLEAVLKAVKDNAQKKKEQEKKAEKKPEKDASSPAKSVSNQYDASLPMSMSEKDAIRSQFAHCWQPPVGAKDAFELVVLLDLEVAQDGTVTNVQLANESRAKYNSDAFFRAAADSAMRAVRQCSPLKSLPPEKYDTWKNMQLNFDPKEMLF